MKILVSIIMVALFISSCEFNNKEELYPDSTCDTTAITYADVKLIFAANCVSCHDKNNSSNGLNFGLLVKLDTYKDAKAAADSGLLFKAVNWISPVTPMPYGTGTKLDNCNLNMINAWIHQGTKE